jgi:manganese-dependent inorganic pyrophosphatase
VLRSVTTTDVDREMAEYLSNITNLEIEALGVDIMGSASEAARLPADEMIKLDMKEYETSGEKISVSQIEVTDTDELLARGESVLGALKLLRSQKNYYLAALLATDVTKFTSLLFVDSEKPILTSIAYPKAAERVFILHDVLSRKKQLMPMLFELVEKAKEK